MVAFCLRRVENTLHILQLDRITLMLFFGAIQFEFVQGGCDGNQAFTAKRIDCSIRVFAMNEEGQNC